MKEMNTITTDKYNILEGKRGAGKKYAEAHRFIYELEKIIRDGYIYTGGAKEIYNDGFIAIIKIREDN